MSAAEEIIENEAASRELLDRLARGDERFVTIYLDSDEEGGLRAVQHVPEGFRAISLIGTVLPRRPAPEPREAEGDEGEDEREVGAAELLAGAVAYVLERASEEPDGLGRYLSPTTSAWRLLVAAEAAHLGKCPVRHRILREGGDPARVLEAWERLEAGKGDVALVRTADGVERVSPTFRAGPWVVHDALGMTTVRTLSHGPTGMEVLRAREMGWLTALAAELARMDPAWMMPESVLDRPGDPVLTRIAEARAELEASR